MFALFLFIVIAGVAILIIGFYQKSTNAVCKSDTRLDGKTVIVTGGTAGMGLEISVELARRGARTIVACQFPTEGEVAKNLIKKRSRNHNIVYKYLDLASLESIRKFANDILTTEQKLHILINNAGIGTGDDFLTSDGINFVMQVNYFGTFLLTLLLLPLLKKSGKLEDKSRIINTSSVTHWMGTFDPDIIRRPNYLVSLRYYADSKFCLLLFTHELSNRLKGFNVVVNSVDPGAVGTRIFLSGNKYLGLFLMNLILVLFKTPWQGAQTALYAALDRKAGELSGEFLKNCQLTRAKSQAYDDNAAKKLWEQSVKLVKLSDIDLDKCFKS